LVLAYILAKVEAGKDKEVLNKITGQVGVSKACATYGIYDLFMEFDFEKIEELDKFVFEKLRKIPGVVETVTMISSGEV
jgi:DNA-binding Lrp family transcriptional regulator